MFCLAFDIGGTNCRMAVYSVCIDGDAVPDSRLEASAVVPTSDLKTAGDLLEAAKKCLGDFLPACRSCAVACAAPVIHNVAEMTNAHLVLSKSELQALFGMPAALVNDYEAVCYACMESTEETAEAIWGNGPAPGSRAVFGAGTGLGCAAIVENGGRTGIILSEGGHMSCPFEGAEELAFKGFLEEQGLDQPSYEDVLSGRGLKNLVLHKTRQSMSGRECGKRYLQHNPDSNDAGRLYARILGRFARNFALCTASWGGLWIAGGITVENRELVSSASFRNEFVRGRHRELLEKMPVFLFRDGSSGLSGALSCAIRIAKEQTQEQAAG